MKKRKHTYFKDDIRKLLIFYAIIPVLMITMLGMFLYWGLWNYSVTITNRNDNKEISKDFENTMDAYIGIIEQLEQEWGILVDGLTVEERVRIFEGIYNTSNQLKRKANLFVFDKELKPLICATKELPDYINGGSNKNWGIFRIMNQKPFQVALKIVEGNSGNVELFLGKAIVENEEIKGYAIFVFDSKQFQRVIDRFDSRTVITDKYGWIYVLNDNSFLDEMERVDIKLQKKQGKISNDLGTFLVSKKMVLENRIVIYSISPMDNQILLFRYLLLCLLGIFVMLVVSVLITTKRHVRKKTKNLDTIIRGFEKVKEGNLNTHISINSQDEFETIAESYNLMIDSLREQITKNIEMGRLVADSQTKQLESQFNPHFLFNTLDNIRFMCKLDADSASKMVLNLSTILRYSISNKEEEVTVKEDLVYTENYMSILKYRFSQRFQYMIHISDEVKECIIPKLIFQPMIENAIKYGFEGKEHLLVEVNGYVEGNQVILQCSDDGAGMTKETLEEIRKVLTQTTNQSSHSGLYNIHRRIQIRYGEDYGIQIESTPQRGTVLQIKLPGRYKKDGGEIHVEGIDC